MKWNDLSFWKKLAITFGALLILLTSLLLVRRVTLPLSRLSEAVRRLGRSQPFQPVPETGPAELAELRTLQQIVDHLQPAVGSEQSSVVSEPVTPTPSITETAVPQPQPVTADLPGDLPIVTSIVRPV